jgi:hypothetical protein
MIFWILKIKIYDLLGLLGLVCAFALTIGILHMFRDSTNHFIHK